MIGLLSRFAKSGANIQMTIQVRFFASLREQLGRAEAQITSSSDSALTVGQVWEEATQGQELPANVLMAVNMDYASQEHTVQDGDEVAFFPPVTGG